jgi:methionyl-tRNA formyltransferase
MNPWPSAYTYLDGKTLKIWKAEVCVGNDGGTPGTFTVRGMKEIDAVCGEGHLLIRELQMEGRRRMTAGEFLRGYRIQTNCFGNGG